MNISYSSNEKLRRLEIARDLFSELLLDGYNYPSDVEIELEKNLVECEKKIENFEYKKIENIVQKKYAKIWDTETVSDGKIIDKPDFDEFIKNKSDYDIFIIDSGEYYRKTVGRVYFKGIPMFPHPKKEVQNKVKSLTPLPYRLLVYTLKHNGSPGEIFDLLEFCWFEKDLADGLRKLHKNSDNEIINQDVLHSCTGKIRKIAHELSVNFLIDDFGIELKTSGTGFYSLNEIPRYCVIECL